MVDSVRAISSSNELGRLSIREGETILCCVRSWTGLDPFQVLVVPLFPPLIRSEISRDRQVILHISNIATSFLLFINAFTVSLLSTFHPKTVLTNIGLVSLILFGEGALV